MTTSDPPHELHGPLGQVVDLGGGFVPLLARTPVPNALANASPGLATNAAVPIASPTLPPDDPQSIALAIARIAGELLGGSATGSSVAPVPAPQNAALVSAGGAPVAPGYSPALAPAGVPSDPSAASATTMPVATIPTSTTPTYGAIPTSVTNSAVPSGFSPGGFAAFDPVALLGGSSALQAPSIDAPPGYLPDASALGLESEVAPTASLPHEIQSGDPIVRDLGGAAFDPYAVRRDFPILDQRVNGKPLVWLDNAATTQKPRAVIERLTYFYERENSNVHRGAHTLAARATDAYEQGRETTRKFLNAPSTREIVFVRGATEGINLVAKSWGARNINAGDEIVITHLEHHANIVPWQQLCADKGATLRVAPVDDRGDVILEAYEKLLGPKTKLVALPQVSNALGTITPAREMTELAHRHGARVLVDGAQAVSHMRVDVQAINCDFYVFSGHKVFAPTGIGVVYGKREVLEAMPPWQGGGNMIQDVTFERTTYQPPPVRFEAGTGNIADAAGLGAALDYVMRIGMDVIDRYEHELLEYATHCLNAVRGLHMIGTSVNKAGVLSFILDGHRTEDLGAALDQEGIAVRSGHHCAQPILRRFGLEATVRASLAFYNTYEDIDALAAALHRLQAQL